MFDYAALAALAAVVREGGFDRAAASLGVTPSAVSQRVRALEERLGTVLVVRSQPPAATDAGARLCAHFERVRLLEGEVTAVLPHVGPGVEPARTLRVAVNADSLGTWFPQAAAEFAAETGVLLDLVLEDEAHTAARLRSGEVLAAVTAEPAPAPGCRTLRLGALRYAAVASPAYLARHFPEGVTAEALTRAPMLRFDRRDRLQARWMEAGGWPGVAPPTHWVPTCQAFLDLCLAGMGWALNPVALAGPHLAAGRLVELVPGRGLEVPLYWQHVRLGTRVLELLTRKVAAAARRELVRDTG